MVKTPIEILTEMADDLEVAQECEDVIMLRYEALAKKPSISWTEPEMRRLRAYNEAKSNRRRFAEQEAALRKAITVLTAQEATRCL